MDENSTFIGIITINACFIPALITLITARKLYFKQKIEEIEIKLILNETNFINLFYFLGNEKHESLDKKIRKIIKEKIEFSENKKIKLHDNETFDPYSNLFKEELHSIRNNVENILDLIRNPFSDKENITKTISDKEKTKNLLRNIQNLSTIAITYKEELDKKDKIFQEIIKLKGNKSSLKPLFIINSTQEDLNSILIIKNKYKEALEERLKKFEEIKAIEFQESNFDYKKIYLLVSYQLIIGISIPLMLISTSMYGSTFNLFKVVYDRSIFYGLTLATLSLLPYSYYLGKFAGGAKRHTKDTQTTQKSN